GVEIDQTNVSHASAPSFWPTVLTERSLSSGSVRIRQGTNFFGRLVETGRREATKRVIHSPSELATVTTETPFSPLTGSGNCGKVRFRMEVAPIITHCCHC